METTIGEAVRDQIPGTPKTSTRQGTKGFPEAYFRPVPTYQACKNAWHDYWTCFGEDIQARGGRPMRNKAQWEIAGKVFAVILGNPEACARHGLDPNKGLLMMGNPGQGKSLMLKVLWHFLSDTELAFSRFECRDIAMEYEGEGAAIVAQYGKNKRAEALFDDLGSEPSSSMRYGNRANVMAELLLDRYELFQNHGIRTHLITNLDGDSEDLTTPGLLQIYGNRVYSRIKEMCNVIIVPPDQVPDFRDKSSKS